RNPCEHNNHRHLEDELEQIRNEYAPQSTDEGVDPGEWNNDENADRECRAAGIPECVMPQKAEIEHAAFGDHRTKNDRDDADHCTRDPAENEAVHEQAEIDRFESAQEGCWIAAVSNLAELDVGENFRTTPIAGEEEHGQHAADTEPPPDPVAGDSLPCHYPADK